MITGAQLLLGRVQREESGQAIVEYSLFLALIALTVVVGLRFAGVEIASVFSQTGNLLTKAVS